MAKLPVYQQQQITELAPAPKPVHLEAGVQTANVINKSLDQLIGYAKEGAERYATESAIEFNLDNPITIDQYKEASKTGKDPIKQFKTGGMVYNDTLKKLYASQASTAFIAESQTHYENVLQQVERGELRDPEEIKRILTDPVKGYSDVIQRMDPATASTFRSRSNYYGHTYYRRAMGELNKLNEFETQQTVDKFNQGLFKTFTEGLRTASTSADIQELKDVIIADASDTYRNTANYATNMNYLKAKLTSIENDFLAAEIAKEAHMSKSLDQLMQEMTIDNTAGALTDIYANKLPDEQADIRAKVKTEYNNIKTTVTSNKSAINKLFTRAETSLNNLQKVDLDELSRFDIDMEQAEKLDRISTKQAILDKMLSASQSQLLNYAKQFQDNIPEEPTDYDRDMNDFVQKTKDNILKKISDDPMAYIMSHPTYKGTTGNVVLQDYSMVSPNDIKNLQFELDKRRDVIQQFKGDFSLAKNIPLFSNDEVDMIKGQLDTSTPTNMLLMFATFNQAYDGDRYELYSMLDKKQPGYGIVGGLIDSYADLPPELQNKNMANVKTLINGLVRANAMSDAELKESFNLSKTDMDLAAQTIIGNYRDVDPNNPLIPYIKEAAKVIYLEQGGTTQDDYANALEIAAGKVGEHGGFAEYNNQKVLIPSYLTEKTLRAVLAAMTLEDLQKHAIDQNGQPIDIGGYDLKQFQGAGVRFRSVDVMEFFGQVGDKRFGIDGRSIGINMKALYDDLKFQDRIDTSIFNIGI